MKNSNTELEEIDYWRKECGHIYIKYDDSPMRQCYWCTLCNNCVEKCKCREIKKLKAEIKQAEQRGREEGIDESIKLILEFDTKRKSDTTLKLHIIKELEKLKDGL